MASREFEVLFRINGALSSEFAGAMRAAQSQLEGLSRQARVSALRQSREMQQLQGYLGNLQKKMADVGKFKQLQNQIAGTSNELVRARLRTAQLTQEYQNQKKQTDQMRQSLQRLKTVFKENKSSMSADQRATMQSQIRAAQQELKDQKEREKSALGNLTSHNTNTAGLQSRLASQQRALRELQGSMSQAGVNTSQLASYEARLRAEIERTTQAIERQNQINLRRQETFDRHNQASQNLSNAYGNFQGATDTARSIMSPFKAAVDEAVTFEQSMSKLKALTQVRNIREGNIERVNREMTAMGDTIKMLGDTTEFTRTEVAQAAQKYAMSGWNQEQINAVLQPTIDVATATGEKDVIKIADMLSDEMQAMGMKAGQQVEIAGKTYDAAKHWGDVFAYATNQSNVDATAFHEALKYNAPVGHAAGMTAHEIAAVNMTMANSAIKGSMSGTAMRSGILRILAPPKTAAKDLSELDAISMSDAQKQLAEAQAEMESLGISQTDSWTQKLEKMQAAFKTMDRSEALTKMSTIFGKNAVSGWAAFFDTNSFETFQGYMKDLDSGVADNWVKDTAEVMRDNTANKFALFESAMAGAANSVGTVFLPVISEATTMLTNFANSFGQWAEQNQTAVAVIGALAAAVAGLIVAASGAALAFSAFQFVSTGLAALKTAAMGLIPSFAGVSIALGPVLIAIVALAAAGYYVYTHWSQVAPVFESLASTLGGALQGAIQTISAAFENFGVAASNLAPAFSNLGGVIFGALAIVLNAVVNIAATIISTFGNAVATVINVFGFLGQAISAVLAGDFSKAGEALKNALVAGFEGFINTAKSLLGGVFDTFANFFKPIEIMSKAPSGGGSFGTPATPAVDTARIVETVAAAFKNVTQEQNKDADLSKISEAVKSAVDAVKTDPKADVAPLLQEVANAIKTTKEENPEADTAKLESVLSVAMAQIKAEQTQQTEQKNLETESLQTAITTTADSMNQIALPMTQAAEGINQMTQGQQTFNAEMQNTQSVVSAANLQVQESQGALSTFNAALSSTNGGLQSLSSSSSSAASAVSSLGSAASSAVSAMQSAAASAASAANAAASAAAAKPAANAQGGIYNRGAFLTWFAEKSPEAAIPLDKSTRAISLWQRVGQMLGVLPKETSATYDKPSDDSVSARSPKYDELGNIIGLHGLKDNVITKDDDVQVARSKKIAQLDEWKRKNPAPKKSVPAKKSGGFMDFLPSLPNIGGFVKNILPENPVLRPKNQWVGENFEKLAEPVKQSKSFEVLQAARNRLQNTQSSGSIFGGGDNFGGGILSSLADEISPSTNTFDNSSPIDLKFEINIQGNANADDVQNGIVQSIPMLKNVFENQFAEYKHELQRKSFA